MLSQEQGLASIKFEHELAWCTDDVHCQDPGHINTISRLHNEIVSALYMQGRAFRKKVKTPTTVCLAGMTFAINFIVKQETALDMVLSLIT